MWVRKQGSDAVWQDLHRHVKPEGVPSTLQQVHIERKPENSKLGSGFEFLFQAPTAAVAKPPPRPALTISHTPSVASWRRSRRDGQ